MTSTQYGRGLYLSDPSPSKHVIRKAKRALCQSARADEKRLGKTIVGFEIQVVPHYELYDPITQASRFVCVVAWKAGMK